MFDGKQQLIRQSEAVGPENQIRGKEKGKPRGRAGGVIDISLQATASRSQHDPHALAEQLHTPSRPTLRTSKQARESQSANTAPAEKIPAARFITKTAYPFPPYHRILLTNTRRQTPHRDIIVKRKRKERKGKRERKKERKEKHHKSCFCTPARPSSANHSPTAFSLTNSGTATGFCSIWSLQEGWCSWKRIRHRLR